MAYNLDSFEIDFNDIEHIFNESIQHDAKEDALVVIKNCFRFRELSKSYRNKNMRSDDYIKRWCENFNSGYASDPLTISFGSSTVPDSLIDEMLKYFTSEDDESIKKMSYGHIIGMKMENISGYLLERYLAENLKKYGWVCCYGETMRAVDFCNSKFDLLQVKNSDNSENSSSKAIRDFIKSGKIKVWFRRFSTKKGKYNWEALRELVGGQDDTALSEQKYREYIKSILTENRKIIDL